MKFIRENWFKIGLLAVSLVLLIVLYQAIVVVPRENSAKALADQQLQEMDKRSNISKQNILRDLCLSKAHADYISLMENNSDNITGKWNSLNAQNYVESKYTDDKDFCLKQYPVNN